MSAPEAAARACSASTAAASGQARVGRPQPGKDCLAGGRVYSLHEINLRERGGRILGKINRPLVLVAGVARRALFREAQSFEVAAWREAAYLRKSAFVCA